KTTIYQIYPRSFFDSNGDGIGDLRGILQKLDYISGMGFETIWLSPFFVSPQQDFGYDISDYTAIAPKYGTTTDVQQLIEAVHQRGMKIVFDLVMNHTSSEHPWFTESRSSRHNPKADWFIWRDRPNNWQSMTGGSGWHYARGRNQYYWASFLPFQPDLNYRNPQVKETMLEIVRFWLKLGVDGFRLDIFNVIYKDAEFQNNPFSLKLAPTEDDPSGFFQETKFNLNQPESLEFARELRHTCDEFGEVMLLGEVSGRRSLLRNYLGGDANNGLGLIFDFGMLNFKFEAGYFRELIRDIEHHFPAPFMPLYVFSNHDRRRSMCRLGGDVRKAKLLHTLQMTVRGVPCTYYGEELGMTDLPMSVRTALDPLPRKFKLIPHFVFDWMGTTINRDEVRTPMQWDGTQHAGFSQARQTWLPVNGNYREINVQKEKDQDRSLLNTIRALLKIRRMERTLQEGSLELLDDLPRGVLGYQRHHKAETVVILMNFTDQPRLLTMKYQECLFKLTALAGERSEAIRLDGFGGVILRS
ncbi:MAG: alpha-glucosidase, partial [Anaerolineaceae bacterium]|nr:alpha-glucosidase [Anaerolineaceae bacterium]